MWVSLLFVSIAATLPVVGTSRCPTPAEVQERLDPLLADRSGATQALAVIEITPSGLRLRLLGDGDRVLAERLLPATDDCATLAAASAIALMSLYEDLPEAAPPPPARLAFVTGGPAEVKVVAPPRSSLELGAAALAAVTDQGAAPGVLLAGVLAPAGIPWGGQALFSAETTQQLAVGTGFAHWERWSLGAGGVYAVLRSSRFDLQLSADGFLSLLDARGVQFPRPTSFWVIDPGLGLGARATIPLGAWVPWIGLWVLTWLNRHPLVIAGSITPSQIPDVELLLALGVDYRFPL